MYLIALGVVLCALTTLALVMRGFWQLSREVELDEPSTVEFVHFLPQARSARQMAVPGKNPAIRTRRTRSL